MGNTLAIEADEEMVLEVVRRYGLADTRGAVHLALKTLLELDTDDVAQQLEKEHDEFSDLSVLRPARSPGPAGDTG